MIPKHVNPSRQDRAAVAPYNFVPLPEAVVLADALPPHNVFDENLLTGKLTCTLTTASPLYVRAAQTLKQYDAKEPPADSAYGELVTDLIIPGSSLRGMLRMMVEIIAYGKIAPVNERQLFFRTVDETSVGAGYRSRMTNKVCGGFFHQNSRETWIEPAIVARVEQERLHAAFGGELYRKRTVPRSDLQYRDVSVKLKDTAGENLNKFQLVEEFDADPTRGPQRGKLVITGNMPGKKKEFVFVPLRSGQKLVVTDEQLEMFNDDDQLTQHQKDAFPQGNGRKRDGWLKDGDPVFYLPSDDGQKVVFFGRAMMFRLPYLNSPADMVPQTLRVTDRLDLAEAMFGRVADKVNKTTVAGRVFVTDARLQGDGRQALLTTEPITLKVLSGPKATTVQHYLTQRYPDHNDVLDHYQSNPNTESTLRGHKLYWHKGRVRLEDIRADADAVHKTPKQFSPPLKPVKADQTFVFDIHFENLHPAELGALLWILDKAADARYRLKLGMGKPYGLGAVAIQATAHLTDRKARYTKSLFSAEAWHAGELSTAETALKLDDARQAFARLLLDHPQINPARRAQTIEELERVKELLALLNWEAPPLTQTRYMELPEFTGKGKFDKRPVLPTPQVVLSGQRPTSSPQPPKELRDAIKQKRSRPDKSDRPVRVDPKPTVAAKPAPPPLPEPPKTEAAVNPLANEILAQLGKRSPEEEAKEERKRQLREAKKNKKK
jgi:CRISPR-associated protein (TIGR03986 family)